MAQEAAGPAHGEPTAEEDRLVPLMIAYQAGRLDAFEALYLALADDVRRFFAASVLEPSTAHDLAQQTFLELHRARHTYRPPRPVRPWVFGIAVNVRRRHAWLLHHVHGFSFEEIGARLGIGAGAAKLRSSRAMRGLRALLVPWKRDDD